MTIALIAFTTGMALAAQALGPRADDVVAALGFVSARPSWITIATSIFVHNSVLHAGGHMLYLWLFGENVEDRMGHVRFLVFYLLGGMTAAILPAMIAPSATPTIGAAGAMAGVMGAYVVLFPNSRIVTVLPLIVTTQVVEIPSIFFVALWVSLRFVIGLQSAVNASAVGPAEATALWVQCAVFVAGAGAVFLFRRPERLRVEWWNDTIRRE